MTLEDLYKTKIARLFVLSGAMGLNTLSTVTANSQQASPKTGMTAAQQQAVDDAKAQEQANKEALARRIQAQDAGRPQRRNQGAGNANNTQAPPQSQQSQPDYSPQYAPQYQSGPQRPAAPQRGVTIETLPGDRYIITNRDARMQIHMYPDASFEIWPAGPVGFCPVELPTSGPEFGRLNKIQQQVEQFYENRYYSNGNPAVDNKLFNQRAGGIAASLGVLVALKNQECVQQLEGGPGFIDRPGFVIRFGINLGGGHHRPRGPSF